MSTFVFMQNIILNFVSYVFILTNFASMLFLTRRFFLNKRKQSRYNKKFVVCRNKNKITKIRDDFLSKQNIIKIVKGKNNHIYHCIIFNLYLFTSNIYIIFIIIAIL